MSRSKDGGEVVVVFRWRRDPHRYAVRFPLPGGVCASPWTGIAVTSVQEWAADVAGLLTEELDTGAVGRARRVTGVQGGGGIVELDLVDAPDPLPPGYYASAVPLGAGAGWWLAEHGLDITVPRRDLVGRRLVCWLQLCTDTVPPSPVGQACVARHPSRPATAVMDVLEILPGVPDSAVVGLERIADREATELGCPLGTTRWGLDGRGRRNAGG